MNAQAVEALIEKVKSLRPEQRAEVEDFVDFLKPRKERANVAAPTANRQRCEHALGAHLRADPGWSATQECLSPRSRIVVSSIRGAAPREMRC
jgi:hypothetical protein